MEKNFVHESLQHRSNFQRIISFTSIRKTLIIEFVSLIYVMLFLYTGIAKLIEFDVFREQLSESPLLAPVAVIVAMALPIMEIVVSVLLFLPRYRRIGLYTALTLMLIFTGYVVAILLFNKELPCSCGGIIEELSWPAHLILNIGLTILCFIALLGHKGLQRRIK